MHKIALAFRKEMMYIVIALRIHAGLLVRFKPMQGFYIL
jgi:hypothetical protein